MRRHNDRPARLGEEPAQDVAALGVEPRGRLVEEHDRRAVQADAGQCQPLEHPARELGRAVAAAAVQPDPVELLGDAGVGHGVEGRVELEVLAGREVGIGERVVAGVADLAADVGGAGRELVPGHGDAT